MSFSAAIASSTLVTFANVGHHILQVVDWLPVCLVAIPRHDVCDNQYVGADSSLSCTFARTEEVKRVCLAWCYIPPGIADTSTFTMLAKTLASFSKLANGSFSFL